MDQATPANQSILRNERECGEDAGVDRDLSLCTGCHPEETFEPRA